MTKDVSALVSDGEQVGFAHENAQHLGQVMAAAQDHAALLNDTVKAMTAVEPWRFLNPVEGRFRRAAKDREHGLVAPQVDGVIAPLAFCNLAAIDGQDGGKFPAIEGDGGELGRSRSMLKSIGCAIGLAQPEGNYGFRITHQMGPSALPGNVA
jgi:hypothetical protein